ncbi:MAG: hypothetical protein ACLS9A_08660 [Clostridia bacterium]
MFEWRYVYENTSIKFRSSSLKYQVIDMKTEKVLAKGYFERIGQADSFLTHKVNGEKHKFEHYAKNHEQAISYCIE